MTINKKIPPCFLLTSFFLITGCNREVTPISTAPSGTTTTTQPQIPASNPSPIADQSLSADQYITLGLPSYDHEWMGQDMAVAAAKLQALAATRPEELPRFDSSRSGPMFARIVSPDNLNFFRSRSLPLSSRFPQSLDYMDGLNSILKIYISALDGNNVTAKDLVEIYGANLRCVQVELELVDEFLPTLSKNDPKYPVRMAGLDKMRKGLAIFVSGILIGLTEVKLFDADNRSKLLTYCRETFPSIIPKLTAPSQAEMLRRLNELIANPSIQDVRPQLISLRDEVQAALKPTG